MPKRQFSGFVTLVSVLGLLLIATLVVLSSHDMASLTLMAHKAEPVLLDQPSQ